MDGTHNGGNSVNISMTRDEWYQMQYAIWFVADKGAGDVQDDERDATKRFWQGVENVFAGRAFNPPPPVTTWPFRDHDAFWGNHYYWVDAKGKSHAIENMSLDYISNVLNMLVYETYKVRHTLPLDPSRYNKRVAIEDTLLFKSLQEHMLKAARGNVRRPIEPR